MDIEIVRMQCLTFSNHDPSMLDNHRLTLSKQQYLRYEETKSILHWPNNYVFLDLFSHSQDDNIHNWMNVSSVNLSNSKDTNLLYNSRLYYNNHNDVKLDPNQMLFEQQMRRNYSMHHVNNWTFSFFKRDSQAKQISKLISFFSISLELQGLTRRRRRITKQ